jgi:hypothetical protein
MSGFHQTFGAVTIFVNAIAGILGGVGWLAHRKVPGFWVFLRAGQALILLEAVTGAALLLDGKDLPRLHLIYGLVPIAVAFVAEQLRLLSATQVLERHDLEDSSAVATLPQDEQHALVAEILRREVGTMAASALVVTLLALRAQGWL